jgi:hypothetical protein
MLQGNIGIIEELTVSSGAWEITSKECFAQATQIDALQGFAELLKERRQQLDNLSTTFGGVIDSLLAKEAARISMDEFTAATRLQEFHRQEDEERAGLDGGMIDEQLSLSRGPVQEVDDPLHDFL